MDYPQRPTEQWLEVFRARGYPAVTPVGGGVEGAVYRLEPGRVAKVWAERTAADLQPFADFYGELATCELPFATPVILDIDTIDGRVVTVERELIGRPMRPAASRPTEVIPDHEAEGLVAILAALRDIPWFDGARRLTVLDEPAPLVQAGASWPVAMAALMGRKFEKYWRLLVRDVPDLDALVNGLAGAIQGFEVAPRGIVHGDLFGANVLVNDARRVSAVLDFGFVTCAGDPDFDAAIVSIIADQYGTQARASEAVMDALLIDRFAIELHKLLIYKGVYALITSGHFSPDASDGHYRWAVDILNRPELRAAAGS